MHLSSMRFHLRDWAAWEGRVEGKPLVLASPASLRRRVSPLGQIALQCGWNLTQSGQMRLIFSSRHGEYSRTVSLFESLTHEDSLSPTDFTLSVHHALIGLLSIAQGNRQGHTAIASGAESFCYGLLEALVYLKENPTELVMMIHCDDLLPQPFKHFNEESEVPVAIALLLAGDGIGDSIEFSISPPPEANRPSRYANDFLEFLTGDASQMISTGEMMQCQWKRHAAA